MNQEEMIERLLNIDLDLLMEDIIDIAIVLDSNYGDKPSNFYMKYIHLSNIELGKHPVNIKTLYKLAQFFEVDMKYFF